MRDEERRLHREVDDCRADEAESLDPAGSGDGRDCCHFVLEEHEVLEQLQYGR